MMGVKHTPGPWHTGQGPGGERVVFDERGWAIADAKVFHGNRADGEDHANARLIASAPELLAALVDFEECAAKIANVANELLPETTRRPWAGDWHRCLVNARAAIARATGEA